MAEELTALDVRHDEEKKRYEAWSGETLAGVAYYRERADRTIFTHTEVEAAFEGKGVGKALAAAALDDTVRRGRVIVPLCPFIAAYLRKHPEYDEHVRWPEGNG
ncbi:N-acetyltransferase [Actinoallomurus sp. NBC_01490]|jgi:predicted GNAT family acetyltransferase|uniref:GNAT family N-acetyltransferase n=1 Tax=Actinoallomurus sp. NBC_01490 TaxID=2903557 RepID=UPI002E315E0F|nr:GNAT family N-acetyltransferase [Actinoallomurus sp. NBC_01490]